MKGLFLAAQPLRMRSYILRMAFLSLAPSLVVGGILFALGASSKGVPEFQKGEFGSPPATAITVFLLYVVFAPVTETLLMSLGITLLSLFTKAKAVLAILSAVIWAVFHSLVSPVWGLVVCWPFFVFSCAYLAWRPKTWFKAIWVAACIHALQNLLPALVTVVYLNS